MNIFIDTGATGGAGWNPADKDGDVTLSSGNRAMQASAQGSVRAVSSRSAGHLYFEIATDAAYTTANATTVYAGLADSTMSLTVQPIFGSPGGKWVAVRGNSQYGADPSGLIGTHAGAGFGNISDGVHTVGFEVVFATRAVTVYVDGVSMFTANWSSGGGAMYPFAGTSGAFTTGHLVLNTTTSEFLQSIPVGASAWD